MNKSKSQFLGSTSQIKSKIVSNRNKSELKLFETPSYTKKDRNIQTLVENEELQRQLKKMKFNYAENFTFNSQYSFKKSELKRMSKIEILKSLASQEHITNLVHVANNYNRKIPVTSLNLKFNSSQQYFSFDDPKEKEEIMKLYNMRSKIKEHASLIKKNQSLSSHFLSQVKQRKQSLPKIVENDDYTAFGKKTEKKPSNHQALIDLKISQKEAEMPRNLVTNSIMSLQRRDNLERTLYVKSNMKNELKENAEKLLRKFDNIYFENQDSNLGSPDTKKQATPAQ